MVQATVEADTFAEARDLLVHRLEAAAAADAWAEWSPPLDADHGGPWKILPLSDLGPIDSFDGFVTMDAPLNSGGEGDVVDLHFREATALQSLVQSHGGCCYRVHVDVFEELELVPAHLSPVAPVAPEEAH